MNSYGARPLVSGTIESDPAPAKAQNQLFMMEQLFGTGQSQRGTDKKLLEAERRSHVGKSLQVDGNGEHVPCWAQNIQNQFSHFQDQFTDFRNEFLASQRAMDQRRQRALNRGLKTKTQPLEPVIRLSDGRVAPDFPETLEVLWNSDEKTVEEWLRFYGLDLYQFGRKKRLQTFFGIIE